MIGGDKMINYVLSEKQKVISILEKFNHILKFVLRVVLVCTFIILLLLFLIFGFSMIDSVYNINTGKSKVPLFNIYVVATESMVPTININDAIVVRRVDDKNVNVGDIITFISGDIYLRGQMVTHRVVGKQLGTDGNYFYSTMGDNNSSVDNSFVEFSDIYGKFLFKIPNVGYIQRFVLSPFGFVVSIILPVFFVIIYEVWRIRKIISLRDQEIEIL